MKWNHWIIVIVLLLLIALGGMAAFNTVIGQQQEEIEAAWFKQDEFIAAAYWTRIKNWRPYVHPLKHIVVSSGVGYRMDPMGGTTEALHKGVDLSAPIGTPVYAALSGTVVEHWLAPGMHGGKQYYGNPVYGGYIVIDHGDWLSIYGHLSATEWQDVVHKGYYVEAGQKIGEVGTTGITTGPHLHFEIVVDPLRYLEKRI